MAFPDIIARLAVSLSMDTVAFEKGATLAEKRLEANRRKLQSIGNKMSSIGKSMSLAVTAPLAALAVTSYKAAQESADALGQVNAALKSMGDASGHTLEQLQALAASQMGKSLYDDDEILRKVTANLLTFGSVAGDNFDRAQQAAIDLSARLGQDLQQSTIMVGKALNDPILGLTALRRVGIQFTEQQEAQIKAMAEAGNVAGAQAIMLKELERQFGGAAAAARAADPTAESKQAWAEFQETIGVLVTKVLPPLTEFLTKVLNGFNNLSPGMQKAIVVGAAVAAALGPVLTVFGGLVSVGGPLVALLIKMAPAIGLVSRALLLLALNPAFLAFAAVVGGIYLAWANWDKIAPILQRLYTAAKTWIMDKLVGILKFVLNPIASVKNAFFDLYDAVVGHSYIPDMVDGIAAHMARLDAVMVSPVTKATSKAKQAFLDMASDVQGILDRLFPEVRRLLDFRADRAALEGSGMPDDLRREALRRLGVEFGGGGGIGPPDLPDVGPIGDLDGALKRFEDFADRLAGKAKETTVRVAKSFKDMADETLSALQRVTDAIKSGGFLDIVGAVVNLGLQLGSIGAFGSKIAANINRTVPGRATGGPISAGMPYMVGERGPELIVPRHSGRVVPNNQFGGRQVVEIVDTTGLFVMRVNGQIMRAAPAIARAGGEVGVQRLRYANTRQVG